MKDSKIFSQWDILCKIHILTKHYTLLAEEFGFSMKTILQPIKEQRDAYEHIIRAYTKMLEDSDADYASNNLSKAIGHEYRAFFDTIDYLTIIIREKIYAELEGHSYEEIKRIYPNYDNLKEQLYDMPIKIAEYREKKDIGDSQMLIFAKEYGDLMKTLLEYSRIVSVEIVQKLNT